MLGKSSSGAPAARSPERLLAAVTGCGANGTIADKTGFEDNDGNLQVDKAGCVDWNSFAPLTWTGTAPYQSATSTAVPPFTFYGRTDAVNSGTDTTFVNGTQGKESVSCPGTTTGNVPNKDDLARIYVAGAQSINGDTYLYLAWVRAPQNTPNSDLHVAFEFNQSTVACANGDGLVPRTDGDLLIGYEFQSSTPTLTLSVWSGGAWSAPETLTSANSEGEVWTAAGTTPDALKPAGAPNPGQDEFGEAGLDLTQAVKGLGAGGRPCETFGSVYGASRTSGQSDTADMKDLVGPLPIALSNCASPTITTQASPSTINLGQTKDISDTATLHNGNAPTGNVVFTLYSDSSCKNAVPGVSGSGAISNVGGSYQASYTKTSWTPTAAGTYYWGVSYAGDGNNNPYSACGGANEEIVVTQPIVSITKTADASPVNAGDQIGFTVEVKNTGSGDATGVVLNDPLPAGSGTGVTWAIDTTTGTPAQFVLSGAKGHQTLTLASSTLPAGADYTVHITAQTSATECSTYDNTATLTATNAANPGPASAQEVCNPPHIRILKTADAAQVSAGDPIGFTLTVYNDGKGDATGVSLSDQLPNTPAGLSWTLDAQGAGWGGTCSIAGNLLSCGPVTVPAGTTVAASTFTVHVTSPTTAATGGSCPGTGEVDNTGIVTATNGGTDQSGASTCVAAPGLHILKKADAPQVDAGDPIGFTITVYNDGPGNAKGVTLSDPLPTTPAGLSWSIDAQGAGWGGTCSIVGGTLECGGAAGVTVPAGTTRAASTFTVHITSPTTAATGGTCPGTGTVDNTATVTATNTGPGQSSDSTCVAAPGLHILKTADAPQVNAGDPIGFTITVYNTGAGAANGVQLTDPLPNTPAGLSWSIDAQGAGWGGTCSIAGGILSCGGAAGVTVPAGTTLAASTFTVHISSPTTAATGGTCPGTGEVDNTGTVTATNAGPGQSTGKTCVAAPGLHILKTADAPQVNAGDPIGFTITVYNDGPGDANGVKLSDPLPNTLAGLSWSIDAQGAGWGGTCSLVGGTLRCGGAAGVTVPAGTTLAGSTFTVHISSPTTAATGGTCPGTGTVDNTGTVTATNTGPGQSSDSTCVAAPGLHILKTADAPQVNAGDPIGFTITVYNDGPGDATGVKLSDPLPNKLAGLSWSIDAQGAGWGGTCSIVGGTLSCGGAAGVTVPAGTTLAGSTFTVHITSPTTAATGGTCPGTGTVDNTGTVTAGNTGPGQSTGTTCVAAPAIHILKTADAAQVDAGDPIGFTLTVYNDGPGDATGVTLSDPLPGKPGLAWSIDAQGAGWGGTCSIAGGTLSCGPVTVPAGTTLAGSTFTVHLISPTTLASGGSCPGGSGVVDNTGTVTAANGGSDQSSASTCVSQPGIHIVKTADAPQVNAGDPIGFTLTVYNDGGGAARGVKLSDPLPSNAGLSWSIASQGAGWGGTCSIAGGTLTCGGAAGVSVPAGTTLAGSTYTVHITSPTTAATGGTCPGGSGVVDNTGTVTSTNAGSGQGGSSTCVQSLVDLAITKTGSPSPDTFPGDITWKMVVTNNGPGTDTNVTVGDPVPAGTTFVSVHTTVGSCTGGSVVTCNLGTMAAGASVTITLVTTPTTTGNITNTASVVGSLPETNTANNQASATVLVVGPHKPPKQYCTAVLVRPKQLFTGRKVTLHLTVKRHGKSVAGVRVRIRGPHINAVTKRSNHKGAITRTLRPTKAGIIIFRPIATKSCKTPRVGITNIFTPPVTG